MTDLRFQIVPVTFDDVSQLSDLLSKVSAAATQGSHLNQLVASAWSDNSQELTSRYCLALVASTTENLIRELSACLKSFRTYWDTGREWRTPAGSCLASNP